LPSPYQVVKKVVQYRESVLGYICASIRTSNIFAAILPYSDFLCSQIL